MLQQTRVAAVIPYYESFLERFPEVGDLASAPEEEVLKAWAGLGYYSRARNLQKAAQEVVRLGEFPRDYDGLRALPGIGDYTAAAVASIAFGRPHAAVDGNVRRVVMRLAASAEVDVAGEASKLLSRRDPGAFNQAMMELGATVCVPRGADCPVCPLKQNCNAFVSNRIQDFPPQKLKPQIERKRRTLVVITRGRRDGSGREWLLVPSPRVTGFWELPEPFPGTRLGRCIVTFRHAITNSQYTFEVCEAKLAKATAVPVGSAWWSEEQLEKIPLSTASKKALSGLAKQA